MGSDPIRKLIDKSRNLVLVGLFGWLVQLPIGVRPFLEARIRWGCLVGWFSFLMGSDPFRKLGAVGWLGYVIRLPKRV